MKTLIIAEAGVNHNGSIEIAKKLIDTAANAGVDIVKFQTFKTENLVTKKAKKAEYQSKNTDTNESQFDMIKKLELDRKSHEILMDYCSQKNIEFLSTPFDFESIELLVDLGIKRFKIPSGEITNLPYLRKIGSYNFEVILSTGMSGLSDIENAIKILVDSGTNYHNISILHCNTEYPTPFTDVNLEAMRTIANAFQLRVGYSDHTVGIEVPIAAVALGAEIIEKHFTLDKNMEGPDHKASLEPDELKKMVDSIRNIELAMGTGVKMPSQSESKNMNIARKSIVALTNIAEGDLFSESNLTVKRPGNGISPMFWDKIIGKKANRNYLADDLIEY